MMLNILQCTGQPQRTIWLNVNSTHVEKPYIKTQRFIEYTFNESCKHHSPSTEEFENRRQCIILASVEYKKIFKEMM